MADKEKCVGMGNLQTSKETQRVGQSGLRKKNEKDQ